MKTKSSKQPSTEARIQAGREVFEKYATYLAEVEQALELDPGTLAEMLLAGATMNPFNDGYSLRDSLKSKADKGGRSEEEVDIASAAWEVVGVFANLENSAVQDHRTASRRVEKIIHRHREVLAA
jgi:hypothetical protein